MDEDEPVSMQELALMLDSLLLPNRCVRYWLGHANVIFIGIGQEVIARPIRLEGPRGKPLFLHAARPPIEIQSRYADWSISVAGVRVGNSVGSLDETESAAARLYGKKVAAWSFIDPGHGLCIKFQDDLEIAITPYEPGSRDYVWSLEYPMGMIYYVRSSGQVFRGSTNLPYID